MADTISTPPFVKDIAFGVSEPVLAPEPVPVAQPQFVKSIAFGVSEPAVEPVVPVASPPTLDQAKYNAIYSGSVFTTPTEVPQTQPAVTTIPGSTGILGAITANAPASQLQNGQLRTAGAVTATTPASPSSGIKTDINGVGWKGDWRVRLSLAPNATYLYKGLKENEVSILRPLVATKGVLFPYTPTISLSYAASYDPVELTHTNYKIFQYRNSSVGDISISADFTAQDTNEANYMLAVIHFFKSVTKMFYGQDSSPKAGTPPPLCYLTGYGEYQFDNHPLVVTNFTYSLPNDVDYIRAGTSAELTAPGLEPFSGSKSTASGAGKTGFFSSKLARLFSSKVEPAGKKPPPAFKSEGTIGWASYVPTKMTIQLQCSPVMSRNEVSNKFSLQKYAKGELMKGSARKDGGFGGFW
jgi:hypothetical protein